MVELFVAPVVAVVVALTAIGIYDLQIWLERWDHNRHFCD